MGRFYDSLGTQFLMANCGSHIVIFHLDDGLQWANFLSTRLMGQDYGIKSVLHNFSPRSSSTSPPTLKEKTVNAGTDVTKSSSSTNNLGDSGRGSVIIITDSALDYDYINNARTHVIILSPDTLNLETFPFDFRVLSPKRTLFLLLGVEIEEVKSYFGDASDFVFNKCEMCVIHSDESSIRDAMSGIIKAYENDSSSLFEEERGEYDILPPARQLNKIELMITRELVEKDRDVYFLLERTAEDELVAVLDNFSGVDLPVECVCDRLYKFTLADHMKGEISFKIQTGSHCIGKGSVLALTKLDQLQAILKEEMNPLSVIASALGLQSDDLDSIDTALESKLQQLSSFETLHKMLDFEESADGSITEERTNVTYPSLLHFAADWNLRKFCSQLLHYPGMFDAALTENKSGDDPRSIAFNKGFFDLEHDLIQFVMNNKFSDNDDYITPSGLNRPPPLAPKSHSMVKSSGYINVRDSNSSNSKDYFQMGNFKKSDSDTRSQKSETDAVSPASQASDNVFMSQFGYRDDLDDINPQIFSTGEFAAQLSHSLPGATSSKALKILGVNADDIKGPKMAPCNRIYVRSELQATRQELENIPHGIRYYDGSPMFGDKSRNTSSDNSPQYGVHPLDSKKKKDNRFASFLNKIKKSKRSASEGEIVYTPTIGIKKSHSNRSDKLKKKPAEDSFQERDSGSYSDEEKGKKPKEFKEREKGMSRQRPLSKRAITARQESAKDAPRVPKSNRKSGGFTSFIETF